MLATGLERTSPIRDPQPRRTLRIVLALGIAGWLGTVDPAQACSTAPPPLELKTIPASGRAAVPTDVAILIDLSRMDLDPSFRLPQGLCTLRTLDGALVPSTTERVAVWHAEVRPTEPLAPNTQYELEVAAPERGIRRVSLLSMTFTTGAGPLDLTLPAPAATMQHWDFDPSVLGSSCDPPPTGTCVAIPAGEIVQHTSFQEDAPNDQGREIYLDDGPFIASFIPGSGFPSGGCMRLRHRALNGSYGDATVLCSRDAPTLALSGNSSMTCSPDGILHDGGVTVVAPASTLEHETGCALAHGPSTRGALSGVAGLILLGWCRRRRRPA